MRLPVEQETQDSVYTIQPPDQCVPEIRCIRLVHSGQSLNVAPVLTSACLATPAPPERDVTVATALTTTTHGLNLFKKAFVSSDTAFQIAKAPANCA
jgi:hypothetical protein